MRSLAALVPLAVSLVVTVSACGGEDDGPSNVGKEPRALAEEVSDLMAKQDRYRFTGYADMGGNRVFADMCVRTDGDMAGTITLDEDRAEMVLIDGRMYLKAPYEFYRSYSGGRFPDEAPPAFDGTRYLAFDAGLEPPSGLPEPAANLEGVTVGEVVRRQGRDVIPLHLPNEEKGATTLFIPAKGTPFPVAATLEGDTTQELALTWKESCEPAMPPQSAILDIDGMGGTGPG